MANNLYALVGPRNEIDLKRVQVTHEVQNQLAGLFHAYYDEFTEDVDEEIEFSHDWKADDDELLFFADHTQANQISDILAEGSLELDLIEPDNFANERIRALIFCPVSDGSWYFIQYFYSSQHLSRRGFTLKFDGETFTRLSEPGFSIGKRIDSVFEHGRLKFKNFTVLKRIFDVLGAYVEASDERIEDFGELSIVHIENMDEFKAATNQITRKLIAAISEEGTLEEINIEHIVARAEDLGVAINVAEGRIVFPTNKPALKQLLRFLDHGIYSSPLAPERRFEANSKRPL